MYIQEKETQATNAKQTPAPQAKHAHTHLTALFIHVYLLIKNTRWSYSQISISRSCGDCFYKFELPKVQITLHFG